MNKNDKFQNQDIRQYLKVETRGGGKIKVAVAYMNLCICYI
jgi:hypothetical protein